MNHFAKSTLLIFCITLSFSCKDASNNTFVNSTKEIAKDERHIDLEDGFYYLNGDDESYKVIRNIGQGGMYFFNPEPIFVKDDFSNVETVKEENGTYSLSFDITPQGQKKWDKVLASSVHYIGFVNENKFSTMIKIKGDGATDEVYLKCLSNTEADAQQIRSRILE